MALRPGIWLLDQIMKASPASSIAQMDAAALAAAQATALPDRGLISVMLGRARRGVAITSTGFTASPAPRLPERISTPRAEGPDRPLVLAFHGGGFALGSARQTDWISSVVALAVDAVVVSVDYRLAPAHPFPAAVDDCYEALLWAVAQAPMFGADPARLAVMGESAGGNLAAVISLMARYRGGPAIAHQTLLYPATDLTQAIQQTASYRNNRGIVLTNADMEIFNAHYIPADIDRRDWRLSPVYADDLTGLPPAVVVVAGLDPLHDSGVAYAQALAAAGVEVSLGDFAQMPHGFLNFPYFSKAARPALAGVTATQRRFLRP